MNYNMLKKLWSNKATVAKFYKRLLDKQFQGMLLLETEY